MAIGVLFVCGLFAVAADKQHEEIGDKIGQRMDAIRHQSLRMGQHPHRDLEARQA